MLKLKNAKVVYDLTTDDLPKTIYKYRSWKKIKHRRLLINSEIYMAMPKDFDEKEEFKLPLDYDAVTEELIKKKCLIEARSQNPNANRAMIRSQARRLFKENRYYDRKHRQLTQDLFWRKINDITGVFCSSLSGTIPHMWEWWADDFEGFCVGFDPYELVTSCNILGSAGKMKYYDPNNPPKIIPIKENENQYIEDALTIAYSLPNTMRREDEYRLVKTHIGNRARTFSITSVKEIIVGSYMPEKEKAEFIKIAKARYPDALLKAVSVNENKQLKIEEI